MIKNRSACGVLVLGAIIATLSSGVSDAEDVLTGTAWAGKINIQQVEGPFSYKSPNDLIEIIGFITERMEGDSANFRDCNGKVQKVKVDDLIPVERKCDPPSTGTWVLNSSGKIVLMDPDAHSDVKFIFSGKPEIDPAILPAKYRAQLEDAKPGKWVAVSSTKAGKLDLSFIKKPEATK
jgi:hypothetical protein